VPSHEHAETTTSEGTASQDPLPRVEAPLVSAVRSLQHSAGNAATVRWLSRDLDVEHPVPWTDPVPLTALDAAKKSALETKYSVTVTGPWSAEDFVDLQNGLAMLTTKEAGRLKSTTLNRVASISGGASGLTTVGATKNIDFADSAFDHGGSSGGIKRSPLTVNGVPQGQHVVLHECGHVVLYTNSNDTAEKTWNANVAKWITKDISTQPNGKSTVSAEELYCESFACFHTGPDSLKSDAPQAHAFFKNGSYLS
jgi:hypothetical protein